MQERSAQQRSPGDNPAVHVVQMTPRLRILHFVATGLYSGKSPVVPGTAGTAVAALLLYWADAAMPQLQGGLWKALIAVALTVVGVFATEALLRAGVYGPDADDPQEVVIDEFAGYAVTLLACPFSIEGFVVGFVLFRIFDMTKPPPIRNFERLPGGLGVVADDIAAGIVAAALSYLYFQFR